MATDDREMRLLSDAVERYRKAYRGLEGSLVVTSDYAEARDRLVMAALIAFPPGGDDGD